MPKYEVIMNYVIAKRAKFVVEADDPDQLHDLIGNIDCDVLEEVAPWVCSDYEPPIIEDFEKVHKDTPVNTDIQKLMNEVEKSWEA